jgi:hypothetical protein
VEVDNGVHMPDALETFATWHADNEISSDTAPSKRLGYLERIVSSFLAAEEADVHDAPSATLGPVGHIPRDLSGEFGAAGDGAADGVERNAKILRLLDCVRVCRGEGE